MVPTDESYFYSIISTIETIINNFFRHNTKRNFISCNKSTHFYFPTMDRSISIINFFTISKMNTQIIDISPISVFVFRTIFYKNSIFFFLRVESIILRYFNLWCENFIKQGVKKESSDKTPDRHYYLFFHSYTFPLITRIIIYIIYIVPVYILELLTVSFSFQRLLYFLK